MNLIWKKIRSENKQPNNYYGIFETSYDNEKIKIYVSVTPKLHEFADKRICFGHVYFETNSNSVQDSLFHYVSDDVYFLLKQELNDSHSLSKIAFMEYYNVKKIPKYEAFTSGDYSFENLE